MVHQYLSQPRSIQLIAFRRDRSGTTAIAVRSGHRSPGNQLAPTVPSPLGGQVAHQGLRYQARLRVRLYVVTGELLKEDLAMSTRLLGAALFIAAGVVAAGAQTSSPSATTPGASTSSSVSAATHCRDSSGAVKLKSAMSSTTGTASNTTPSSSPGTSSSVNSPASMPGSNQAEANLPPC